jgi:hypothetical protein
MFSRALGTAILFVCLALRVPGAGLGELSAQGVTTATIAGAVRAADGADVTGTDVRVVNRTTGFAMHTSVRHGRFVVAGLDVGGPYTVVVRRIGFAATIREVSHVSIGERVALDFVLQPLARQLDPVEVSEDGARQKSSLPIGVGARISDSLLHSLPTLNRDLYDFVRLVPQASARQGISGGGVSFRLNSFLIDGVSERQLQGNSPAGGFNGGKTISLEAVKEYQVLLSPYDARYGDFAGILVNAVTKSGTNEWRGSAYAYARNGGIARQTAFLRGAPYDRAQYGFSLGGPLIRDRLHIFLAPELQRLSAPAAGPYAGQSDWTQVPVSDSIVDRFRQGLGRYGLDAGSAGRVTNETPLTNWFGRIDAALPAVRSRLVLRDNYSRLLSDRFARSSAGSVFPLSSSRWTQEVRKRAMSAQLFTTLAAASNEVLLSTVSLPQRSIARTPATLVLVRVTPATGSGPTTQLQAGTPELGQGGAIGQKSVEVADYASVALGGSQTLTLGARSEFFRYTGSGAASYGRWVFSSLDSLDAGVAESYRTALDLRFLGQPLRGAEYSMYANDELQLAGRLIVSVGVRGDAVAWHDRPLFDSLVAQRFARRTDVMPRTRIEWSPRIGFVWDSTGGRSIALRGGMGLFVGRPPIGWYGTAIRNFGSGVATLTCGKGVTPAFAPDYLAQPTQCADGRTSVAGPAHLIDPALRLARTLRTSLALGRRFGDRVTGTLEGLYTKNLTDFIYVNRNLVGPQGMDRRGRVLYGSINSQGVAKPQLVDTVLSEVFELVNQSHNFSYQLAGRLEARLLPTLSGSVAYAYSRVRDVASLVSGSAFQPSDIWATARSIAGRHDELRTGVSSSDIPHRIVLTGTYVAPWTRSKTAISLYYIGESGTPFTYLDSAAAGKGDLNADGTSLNDPIYVPRSAADTSEILFAGTAAEVAAQQLAFERFIDATPCLSRERGRIVKRNSCRSPWVNTMNLSVHQGVPLSWTRRAEVELQFFNVLNLLSPRWGLVQLPNASVLEHVAQTGGSAATAQSIFLFHPERPRFSSENLESAYQLQLAVRYSF